MIKSALVSLIFLFCTSVLAQEVPFKVGVTKQGFGYYDQNDRETVHLDMPYEIEVFNIDHLYFGAKNSSSRVISVILVFDKLNGIMSTEKLPFIQAIEAGETRKMFRLKQASTSYPDYSYKLHHFYGYANPVIKEVDYTLPYGKGLSVKTEDVSYSPQIKYYDNETKFYGTNFLIPQGEIIHAARGGKVILIEDGYNSGDKHNRIAIQHADGTVANYIGFNRNTTQVKIGQELMMGAPLAESQGKGHDGISLLFTVSCIKVEPRSDSQNVSDWISNVFIKPRYSTEEGITVLKSGNSYTCIRSVSLITQEMTRREKKNYLSEKN